MKGQAAAQRPATMSCWVAPTLAAEIWQIALSELMRRIERGEIPVRDEDGFLFVDVAPYGPRIERRNLPPEERPPTFMPVDEDDDVTELIEDEPAVMLTDEEASVLLLPSKDEAEMGPIDETASTNLGDWRAARRQAARKRIPPAPPRKLSA